VTCLRGIYHNIQEEQCQKQKDNIIDENNKYEMYFDKFIFKKIIKISNSLFLEIIYWNKDVKHWTNMERNMKLKLEE